MIYALTSNSFVRQRCRAWIETHLRDRLKEHHAVSSDSDVGRGLKHLGQHGSRRLCRFVRQRCRAWIETTGTGCAAIFMRDSPDSDVGRGLKRTAYWPQHLILP